MLSVVAVHFSSKIPGQSRSDEYLGQLSDQGGYGEKPLLCHIGGDVGVDGDCHRGTLLGGHDDDCNAVFDGEDEDVAGEEVHGGEVDEVEEGGGDNDDDDVFPLLGEEDGCGTREGLPDNADEVAGRKHGKKDSMVVDPFQHTPTDPTHHASQQTGDKDCAEELQHQATLRVSYDQWVKNKVRKPWFPYEFVVLIKTGTL